MENYKHNEDAIIELAKMVELAEDFQAELDDYCEFMKQTFLSVSGLN